MAGYYGYENGSYVPLGTKADGINYLTDANANNVWNMDINRLQDIKPDSSFFTYTTKGDLIAPNSTSPYTGSVYSGNNGAYSLFSGGGTGSGAANSPIANSDTRPSANFAYRPSNDYSRYAGGAGQNAPFYGRTPLAPFIPQSHTSTKPSASALLSAMARPAPVATPHARGGPVRQHLASGGGIGDLFGGGNILDILKKISPLAQVLGLARGGRVGYAEGGGVNDIMQVLSGLGLGPNAHTMPEMARGGPVRGVGGGQQDNVMKDSRVGSFIMPADVMSDLGDGNTDEGHRRWDAMEHRVHMAYGGRVGYAKGGSIGAVPVALSPGEREISPETVAAFGGGSNARGSAKLHEMIKRVRAHKATKGQPPLAKSPLAYMRG